MRAHNELILLVIVVSVVGVSSRPAPDDFVNVGTVLFSPTDLKKTHWPKSEVALLRARTQFQKLIPPPNFIDPSKDYIDKLLGYFRDAFMAIKSEANDPVLDSIMTTALADTIGGYLKLWILPITKFSFYGGTVSNDNAFKIFNFYDEIKKYLATDGSGWRAPDDIILNSISIAVPRSRLYMPNARVRCSKDDPCETFAYFERTSDGFTIPLPTVNWADNTMFIPVKNASFVSLNSPIYHNSLVKYYTDAKHCLRLRSANASEEFDERFQMWLSEDIIPHLMDDDLYLALGSVLSLTDKNPSPYQTLFDEDKGSMSYFGMKFAEATEKAKSCSKKVLFVSLILMVEIIWCIFAVKHTCFKSRKNNPFANDNLTLYFKCFGNPAMEKKSTSADNTSTDNKTNNRCDSVYSFKQHTGSYQDIIGGGFKLHQMPKSKRGESGIQVPSKDVGPKYVAAAVDARSHTSISSKISSNEIVTIVNEFQPQVLERVSKTKSQSVALTGELAKSFVGNTADCCPHTCNCSCDHESGPEEQDDTITLFRKSQRSIERAMFHSEENTTQLRTSISDRPKRTPTLDLLSIEPTIKMSEPECACCMGGNYMCTCNCLPDDHNQNVTDTSVKPSHECDYTCMNIEPQMIFGNQKTENVTQTHRTVLMCVNQQTDATLDKQSSVAVQKVKVKKDYVIKKKEGKRSARKPYLEIKIDRPNAEIKVGISSMEGKHIGSSRKMTHSHSHASKRTVLSENQVPEEYPTYTESNQKTKSGSKCVQKIVDYEKNVMYAQQGARLVQKDTRTVIERQWKKSTQERSAEAVPSVVDDFTVPDYRYEEQASGSYTILPYVEQGANTSVRCINMPDSFESRVFSQTRGRSNAMTHYSKQELVASQQNNVTLEHVQHIRSLVSKRLSQSVKHQGKQHDYTFHKTDDSEDASPLRQKKIKKRIPGMIPKYLRHAVEEQNKAKQEPEQIKRQPDKVSGEPFQTKHDQSQKRPSKIAQLTSKQPPPKTSSPIRRSPTPSMKSACSPIRRSLDGSIKTETLSQYTNKSADATIKRITNRSKEPTPGIPTKTKIPVSPRRFKNRQDTATAENTQKEENFKAKQNYHEDKVHISKERTIGELDQFPTSAIKKKSPTPAFKYSKRYASLKSKHGVETKPEVELKPPLQSPQHSHDATEAQKVISAIMTKADPLSKKKYVKYRSYIPKLKKRGTADDIELESDKKENEIDKLNVTL